jgi:hypothetical protein
VGGVADLSEGLEGADGKFILTGVKCNDFDLGLIDKKELASVWARCKPSRRSTWCRNRWATRA